MIEKGCSQLLIHRANLIFCQESHRNIASRTAEKCSGGIVLSS